MSAVRAGAVVALCGLIVAATVAAQADPSLQAKEMLLRQFDLSSPILRQAREVSQIPKFMLEEYERKTGQKADTSHFRKPGTRTGLANTQLAYPCKSMLNKTEPTQMRSIFECDFRDFEKGGYTMESAFLRVHWTPKLSVKRSSGSFRATVSDLTKARDWISTPQDVKKIFHRNAELDEGSYEFDVTDAVLRWSTQKTKRARLLLEKTKMKVKSMPSVSVIPQGTFDSAYLIVYAESRDQRQRRLERRSAQSPKPSSRSSSSDKARAAHSGSNNRNNRRRNKPRQQRPCQRQPMYVDFERVGWNDWIVAPPGYQAYHCDGECRFPLADHHNATNHATVQVLVNSVNPGAVPPPCCVPTTLSPISLLYLEEEGRVVLKSYENMIAENCGCR